MIPLTLRVEVTDFLNLQGTFQTRRVLVTAAHDKQTPLVAQRRVGKLLQRLVQFKDLLYLSRERQQPLDDLVAPRGQRDPVLGQLECHHQQCDVLGSVGLISAVSDLCTGLVKQKRTLVEATPISGPALM